MREIWLKSNLRVGNCGAIPLALVLGLGTWMASGWPSALFWTRWFGFGIAVIATGLLAIWIPASRRPRLAYEDGFLLVYLTAYRPYRVPIDIVECFFVGQGPSHLTGPVGERAETINVIVRLAERAEQWKHVDVWSLLGHWCDGYITIRGAWCENLNPETVSGLNRRLAATKRCRKEQAPTAPTP